MFTEEFFGDESIYRSIKNLLLHLNLNILIYLILRNKVFWSHDSQM